MICRVCAWDAERSTHIYRGISKEFFFYLVIFNITFWEPWIYLKYIIYEYIPSGWARVSAIAYCILVIELLRFCNDPYMGWFSAWFEASQRRNQFVQTSNWAESQSRLPLNLCQLKRRIFLWRQVLRIYWNQTGWILDFVSYSIANLVNYFVLFRCLVHSEQYFISLGKGVSFLKLPVI